MHLSAFSMSWVSRTLMWNNLFQKFNQALFCQGFITKESRHFPCFNHMTSLHLLLITTKSNIWPSIHFSICVRCALCSYVTLLGRLTWLTVTLHSNPTHTLFQNGETVHKREIMHTTPQTWSPQPWHPNLTTFKKKNYIILNFNYLPKARSSLNWAKSLVDCKLSSAFWKICAHTRANFWRSEFAFESGCRISERLLSSSTEDL